MEDLLLKAHEPQLLASGVPQHFWPTILEKIQKQVFDAGDAFNLLLVDYGEDEERPEEDPVWALAASKNLLASDPTNVFLVDHAWTFRPDQARAPLEQVPGLLERMCTLMGVSDDENRLETVMRVMWRYVSHYSINVDSLPVEERLPLWYIMDEVGSAVQHSDSPNFRMVPLLYIPEQIAFSLLYPIEDVAEGDRITRDFAPGTENRRALLLPWIPLSLTDEDHVQVEPEESYFLQGRIEESLPESDHEPVIDHNRPLKVFSEYHLIRDHLNDPAFEIVDDDTDADVLWYTRHFKGYKELADVAPNRFVNQFPFENVLTIKDLLAIVGRRNSGGHWLPVTFNLKTELEQFISFFQKREREQLDNHWIVKPFNLARSLDTHITDNLIQIIRLSETIPKIVQKYVERPVLFMRPGKGLVKFDIRYVILLRKVEVDGQELDAYVYTNFFLRFSNKPFELKDFDEYEKHFTVMNYKGDAALHHMKHFEFLDEWRKQYPAHKWTGVEDKICEMLGQVLRNASKKPPPCGIGANAQSRAVYAADIMLSWDEQEVMQPKLLEINWTPDCERACQYYPDFYNDIFKLLFLNDCNAEVFRKL